MVWNFKVRMIWPHSQICEDRIYDLQRKSRLWRRRRDSLRPNKVINFGSLRYVQKWGNSIHYKPLTHTLILFWPTTDASVSYEYFKDFIFVSNFNSNFNDTTILLKQKWKCRNLGRLLYCTTNLKMTVYTKHVLHFKLVYYWEEQRNVILGSLF
jgi:hypothetical protein